MNTIWQALNNTPWWVYILFAYLINVGIQASRTRKIKLQKLFIIPIIFTLVSLDTLYSSFQINASAIGVWVISIAAGIILGWLLVHNYQIKVDRKNKLLEIPGNWSTLIIILIIFASKYYFAYQLAMDPTLVEQTTFEFMALGISGICTGFFVGRLIAYVYKFKTSTHTL